MTSKNQIDPAKINQFKRWLDAPTCCLWEDQNGDAHWDIPKLLSLADLPATEENIQILAGMLKRLMAERNSDTKVIERWRESFN